MRSIVVTGGKAGRAVIRDLLGQGCSDNPAVQLPIFPYFLRRYRYSVAREILRSRQMSCTVVCPSS
jgi:hypothetical protein